MLSTQEEIYIKGLTEEYYNNGYKNYICITNNPNTSYNQSYYDIYCYYSKDEIIKTNNIYTIPVDSIKCSIDSKNPTSTNKQNSLNCENYNGNITPDSKEFIYANIGNNSNIMGEFEYNIMINNGILIILTMTFLYFWLSKLFKNRRDINE